MNYHWLGKKLYVVRIHEKVIPNDHDAAFFFSDNYDFFDNWEVDESAAGTYTEVMNKGSIRLKKILSPDYLALATGIRIDV